MAKDRLWVESGGRASQTIYCASVSPIVGSVSATARRKPVSVSDNVRWKPTFIARRAVHHCAPLHLPADETGCQGVQDRPGVAVHLGRDQLLCLLHSGNNLFGDVVDPLFRPRESRKTIRWVQTEQRTAGDAMRSAGMESTRCHHRRGNAVTLDLPICRAQRSASASPLAGTDGGAGSGLPAPARCPTQRDPRLQCIADHGCMGWQ